LLGLLQDPHPRVREHAVLLAEPRLREPALREAVVRLAGDADARLRFQVALTLGEWDDDKIVPPLARIALAGAEDRWARLSVASSVPKRAGALLAELLPPRGDLTGAATAGRLALVQELGSLVGARRDPDEVAGVLDLLYALPGKNRDRWQMAGLNGLAEGVGRRGGQLGAFLKALPAAKRTTGERAGGLVARGAELGKDAALPPEDRVAAVRLLAHAPWEIASPALKCLLASENAQEIRLAAVRALAAQPRPEVPVVLL